MNQPTPPPLPRSQSANWLILAGIAIALLVIGIAVVAALNGASASDVTAGEFISADAPSARVRDVQAKMRAWLADNLADAHYQVVRWYIPNPAWSDVVGVRVRFTAPAGGPALSTLGFVARGESFSRNDFYDTVLEMNPTLDPNWEQPIMKDIRRLANEAKEQGKRNVRDRNAGR